MKGLTVKFHQSKRPLRVSSNSDKTKDFQDLNPNARFKFEHNLDVFRTLPKIKHFAITVSCMQPKNKFVGADC